MMNQNPQMGGMPQVNMQQFFQQMMQMNPSLANNPQAQNIMQVLMSGNRQRGEELARNYAQSYGLDPQDFAKQAQGFVQQQLQGYYQRR